MPGTGRARRVLTAFAERKPGRSLQTNIELNAALLLEAVAIAVCRAAA
jgi:hypothetical protein